MKNLKDPLMFGWLILSAVARLSEIPTAGFLLFAFFVQMFLLHAVIVEESGKLAAGCGVCTKFRFAALFQNPCHHNVCYIFMFLSSASDNPLILLNV